MGNIRVTVKNVPARKAVEYRFMNDKEWMKAISISEAFKKTGVSHTSIAQKCESEDTNSVRGWVFRFAMVLMLLSGGYEGFGQELIHPQVTMAVQDTQLVHHHGYDLLYSEQHEQAYWVSYMLLPYSSGCVSKRKNDFRADDQITTESASLLDYKGSGYDRGHLRPAAVCKCSDSLMSESFLLSNMSPQSPTFNRHHWRNLEATVRKRVNEINDTVYVVTGPNLLKQPIDTIGSNEVSVPAGFYKALFDKHHQVISVYYMDHKNFQLVIIDKFNLELISGIKL